MKIKTITLIIITIISFKINALKTDSLEVATDSTYIEKSFTKKTTNDSISSINKNKTKNDSTFTKAKILKKNPFNFPFKEKYFSFYQYKADFYLEINPDSTINNISTVKSNNPKLDSLIIEQIKKWEFQPKTINKKPQTSYIPVAVINKSLINKFFYIESKNFNKEQLSDSIANFIERKNNSIKLKDKKYFYSENDHCFYNKKEFLLIDYFDKTVFPSISNNGVYLSKLSQQKEINQQEGLYFIKNPEFNIPVALTQIKLGFGNNNMEIGNASFIKNNFLNIPKFYAKIDVSTKRGYWFHPLKYSNATYNNNYENKSYNVSINLKKEFKLFTFSYLGDFSSERIYNSMLKDSFRINMAELTEQKLRRNSYNLKIKNFKLSYDNSLSTYKNSAKKYYQKIKSYQISNRLKLRNNIFKTRINYNLQENDFLTTKRKYGYFNYILKHKYKHKRIKIKQFYKFGAPFKYYVNDNLKITHLGNFNSNLSLNLYQTTSDFSYLFTFKDYYNILYQLENSYKFLNFKLGGGIKNDSFDFNENYYLDNKVSFKYDFSFITGKISTNSLYYNKPYDNQFEHYNQASIRFNLKHNNKITLGVEHQFLGAQIDPNFLNTFIKIDITQKFNLNVNFRNILNNQYYYSNYLNPYHISANINWLFVN